MQAVEEWYRELPPITKGYLTVAFAISLSTAVDFISPFALYFNYNLVVHNGQVCVFYLQKHSTHVLQFWRLISNFFFFGSLGIDAALHMFFLYAVTLLLPTSLNSLHL